LYADSEAILAAMRRDKKSSKYIYTARHHMFGSPLYSDVYGAIGGIRIDGELHELILGHGICRLRRFRQVEEGHWHCCSEEDIGHLSRLETDNFGTIEIRRKNAPNVAEKWLKQLMRSIENERGFASIEWS
jgi:hypothetical protein